MRKTYSKDDIIKCLKDIELNITGEIKTTNDKVLCITKEGYKVFALPSGIIRRNDKPSIFSKYNPYTIDNIKHYLELENSSLALLSTEYKGASNKLKWKCECGEIFETTWDIVIGGKRYCNFCAKSKRYDGLRDYFTEINDKCDKNNYTLLTKNITRSNQKFKYICNKHKDKGILTSTYDDFIRINKECRYCAHEKTGIKLRKADNEKFKSLVESKGFIYKGYDYDNKGKYKKVNIHYLCPNHIDKGIQKIKYDNLLRSNGKCKYCIGRERTKEDLQSELYEMNIDVSILEYIDYASPIKVLCNKCTHIWDTKGVNLTQGHGCPNCPSSNFEKLCSNILGNLGFNFTRQEWFDDCRDKNPLPFDFHLIDFNILIECDGEGHYKPIPYGSMTEDETKMNFLKVKKHDNIKTEFCKNNNIPLIRIPYWERDNMEYFLWDKLVKYGAINELNKKVV